MSWQFLINNNITVGGTTNSTSGSENRTNPSNSIRSAIVNTLDPTNFAKYDRLVQTCLATGAHCIVDVHNYARFNNLIIGQGGPTNAQFANLWSEIATKVEFSPVNRWLLLTATVCELNERDFWYHE